MAGEGEMNSDWEILDNCSKCSGTRYKNEIHDDCIHEPDNNDEVLKSSISHFMKSAASLMSDYTNRMAESNELSSRKITEELDRIRAKIAELRREKASVVELVARVEQDVVKLKDAVVATSNDGSATAEEAEPSLAVGYRARAAGYVTIKSRRDRKRVSIVEMCNELQNRIVQLKIML